jgi:hypothetical protein
MGFQNMSFARRKKTIVQVPVSSIAPYIGVGPVIAMSAKTGAFIQSLTTRGSAGSRQLTGMVLTTGVNETAYFAYPVSFGQAIFIDTSSGLPGGWDGAHGNQGITMGPIIVDVDIQGTIIPFYLYENDWSNIGPMTWNVM